MKKYLFVLTIAVFALAGCRSSKQAAKERSNNEVWQTLLVKQLDATVEDQIITVKYNNGTTLCYKILDNFGNVTLTWDRTNGRKNFDDGPSSYKGDISIPSFITTGQNDEFTFRVMEIDQNAFYGCSEVTSIDIPYSVLRIVDGAFKGCSGIKKFTVNENNQSYKDVDGILFSKDNKMLIKYPAQKETAEYVISEEVAIICTEAFMDNAFLRKVSVGNFVTAISDNSFKNCTALEEVERLTDVSEQIERLEVQEKECKKSAELLTKTEDFLQKARESFQAKYMQPLQNGLHKYLGLIDGPTGTHSGYSIEDFELDMDLNIKLSYSGSTKGAEYLSQGYQDVVALCSRLALVDVLYPDEKPILILDDPFTNLDDKKIKESLKLLNKIAEERQTVYFTCHDSRL